MTDQTPPKERTDFDIVVVTPDKVIFEEVAVKALIPCLPQDLGILPNHTPLYARVTKGDIVIDMATGKQKKIAIDSGVLRVRNNKVSIIMGFDTPETNP